jgi:hypothetical protein
MALKRIFVDIQNDLFDLWTLVSVEGEEEYNDVKGDFEYLLILNRSAVTKDVKEKIYRYTDKDERDEMLFKIKDKLRANPNIFFLGEDDGSINDDEMPKRNSEDFEDDE